LKKAEFMLYLILETPIFDPKTCHEEWWVRQEMRRKQNPSNWVTQSRASFVLCKGTADYRRSADFI